MTKNLFLMRIKPNGIDITSEALMQNHIFVGWAKAEGLLAPMSNEEKTAHVIAETYPNYKRPKADAKQFCWFAHEMRLHDLVIVPTTHKNQLVAYLCEVDGPVIFDTSKIDENTAYRRSVKWLNNKNPIPRSLFSKEFLNCFRIHPYSTCRPVPMYLDETRKIFELDAPLQISNLPSRQELNDDFIRQVEKAMGDAPPKRSERLASARQKPERRAVVSYEFIRNPDVVAEVLVKADGHCDRCGKSAPFQRKKDGTPYLEVHHKKPLSQDGDDTVENAHALCPNCHRQAHYG